MANKTGAAPAGRTNVLPKRLGDVREGAEAGPSDSNNNNTTTAAKTKLPSIKERRPSLQKKSRAASFNETSHDSTTSQRRESFASANGSPLQRRASVPQGPPAQGTTARARGKPSFAGIGRRVSSMVRARLAFQGLKKTGGEDKEEANHMEVIHELPRNPRFSTFLSAEAQYAMMKGYEDKLYENIATSMPESRLVLKRNKTPHHKKISILDTDQPKTYKLGEGDKCSDSPENKSMTSSSVTSDYGSLGSSASPSAPSPLDNRSFSPESNATTSTTITTVNNNNNNVNNNSPSPSSSVALPSPFLKPLRRQSMAVTSDVNGNRTMTSPRLMTSSLEVGRGGGGGGWGLHRSHSLSTLEAEPSHNRRLVLTYRLESAMDILDTLKRRNRENSLSPRMFRTPRKVDAVKDFNSWAVVWNKEFKEVQA